jgi:hypothetical protein
LIPIILFAPNEEEFEVKKILDPWVSYGHLTLTKSIQPLVWMMSKNISCITKLETNPI